jgi:4a-hydroxytetrahydrobiopterin dehydratase
LERKKLSADEIEAALAGLNGWQAEKGNLKKRFSFANFAESLEFVNKAGEIAERRDHHPDILFGWGYAEFRITTHDAGGGITAFDFALAKEIDNLSKK